MYCKNCGKELVDTAKFCSVCGCQCKHKEDKDKKWSIKISIFLIVLALIGIGIALFEAFYEPDDSVKICDRWYLYEKQEQGDMISLEKTGDFIEFTEDGDCISNYVKGYYVLISKGKLKIYTDGGEYDLNYKFDESSLILEYKGNKAEYRNY